MRKKTAKTITAVLAATMLLGVTPPVENVSGTAPFTITAEAKSASKKLTVKASGATLEAGKSKKLKASAGDGTKLSFKSSKSSIASVNSAGVVTGKKAGTAKITVTARKSGYKTATKTVTVKITKKKQAITAKNQTVAVGKTVKLGAKAKTGLRYKTSNKKVATVSSKGVVTGKKAGTAKITITAKETGVYKKASRTITVKVTKKTVAPVKQPETEAPKQTEPAKQPETETPKQTEPAKQPETEAPKQTEPAKQPETEAPKQTEPAKQPETEAPKQTEVPKETEVPKQTEVPKETEVPKQTEAPKETEAPKPAVSYVMDLYFEETSKTNTVYIGEAKKSTLKWTATGTTTFKDFVYTSSDPSIAAVDENGTITGLKMGDVTITATSKTPFSAYSSTCLSTTQKYHIKPHTTEIVSIVYPVINGEDAITEKNIGIGETKNCTLQINTMGEGSTADIDFTSSNPSVATVDEAGNVTGLANGYVTITAKTKLPSDMDGVTILTDSTTYHVGDYTYEEILSGLTVDMEASKTAHNVLNELRQDKTKRPAVSQDFPEVPARTWSGSGFQQAVARGGRNIFCEILGGWTSEEKSSVNPLASHGYSQNGYGGYGRESTGTDLGKAAEEFFYDRPHAQNQTRAYEIYGAVAVVQYKNAAGVNLTSMIVDMSGYSYEDELKNIADYNKVNGTNDTWLDSSMSSVMVPKGQYLDICSHFGLTYGMDNMASVQISDLEESTENTVEVYTEDIDLSDVLIQEEETEGSEPEYILETEEDPDLEYTEEETEAYTEEYIEETAE